MLFNVIIEIPMNDNLLNMSLKEIGAIMGIGLCKLLCFIRAIMDYSHTTFRKMVNPADVLVIDQYPIIPGAIIKVRPVGVLIYGR